MVDCIWEQPQSKISFSVASGKVVHSSKWKKARCYCVMWNSSRVLFHAQTRKTIRGLNSMSRHKRISASRDWETTVCFWIDFIWNNTPLKRKNMLFYMNDYNHIHTEVNESLIRSRTFIARTWGTLNCSEPSCMIDLRSIYSLCFAWKGMESLSLPLSYTNTNEWSMNQWIKK